MEQPFLPILLGSDMNAYGMARAFYEAYGLKPLVLGRSHLSGYCFAIFSSAGTNTSC